MHSVHAGYTVIARLEENCAEIVSALLVEFRAHPDRLPFEASVTTHFATGSVLPAQQYGDEELPACLMIATSFSGPARTHEDDLVRVAGSGLRELFQYCERFPDACSDDELKRFLREHRVSDTFYSGMQNLTRAGDRDRAIHMFEHAARGFEEADMLLHAAAARRRHGTLLGSAHGASMVAAAGAWMATQAIKSPERMTAMLAPG